ncbi:MAG: hypothetical protein RLY66_163 [Candidatus Parcubacteria bacterium]|jgi:hypothetical protein
MPITLRLVAAAVFANGEQKLSQQDEIDGGTPLFYFNGVPIFDSLQALVIGSVYDLVPAN